MLQACSRLMPARRASRVTQSRPNSSRSSASRSSVQTQTRLCDDAELGDGLDRLRQRVPRRRRRAAAQEEPDAGLQQIVGDLAVDRLVRVGDAACRIGRDEFAAVDVAGDRPAALQRRGEDGVAALVAHRDLDEVHLLAERHRLGPAVEQRRDLVRRQVAAGGFQIRRGGRHRARHGEEDRERRLARVLQHRLDAGDVHDVADLVAVAEDRRRAVEQRRLGIGAGRHHAALDMDVRIDEARREDAAPRIVDPARLAFDLLVGTGRLHGGDAPARDPDLALGRMRSE